MLNNVDFAKKDAHSINSIVQWSYFAVVSNWYTCMDKPLQVMIELTGHA